MNKVSGITAAVPPPPRLAALRAAARNLGVELDRQLQEQLALLPDPEPSLLLRLALDAKLDAKALTLRWRDLPGLAASSAQCILLLEGGGAALLSPAKRDGAVALLDPHQPGGEPVWLDQRALERRWDGTTLVLRGAAGTGQAEEEFGTAWFMRGLLREHAIMRDILVASVVMAVLTIAPPLMLMQIADRVLMYQSWSTLTVLGIVMAVIVVFEMAIGGAQRHLTSVLARRLDGRINTFIMNRVLRLPLSYFERNPVGETQARVFATYRLRDFITGPLFRTVLDLVTLLVIIPVLFLINPTLTWFILAVGLVLTAVMAAFMPAISRATARAIAADRKKGVTLIESIQGIRTVKALALEAQQTEAWNANVAEALDAQHELQEVSNRMQTLTAPLERAFFFGSILLGTIILLQAEGTQSVGSLFAFIMLAQRAAAPLQSLGALLHTLSFVSSALSEAASVLNNPPERPAALIGARPAMAGHITFSDVTFTYPGAMNPALREVSFDLPAGSLVGLVGRSGSGKSTVTRLLQALNSGYSGLVKLDGVELREYDLKHLRRNLGVVLQENFLFRGTIRHNIVAGRPGITFEKVIQACRLAGAEEFIERLPAGYDTFIEEGSPNLSGGQRQRLAIARAIVTDPAILILDEATSALDPESEAIVNSNLRRLARGRTVVVVSHRLTTLVDCDTIIVMDRGRVEDTGNHATLLARGGSYAALWQQQTRSGSAAP